LADLASNHGHKLATFDEGIAHNAIELITGLSSAIPESRPSAQ
jgi:hypothetical protein